MTMATFVDFFFYFVMVLMVTVFWPLSFTSVNHCLCTNVKDPRLTNSSNSLASVDLEILGEETSQSSTIYFNNPHLLKDQKAFLGKGLRNGPVFGYSDVETIGGVYLQDEAHIIARHLRTISNEELGVTSMQVNSWSFASG